MNKDLSRHLTSHTLPVPSGRCSSSVKHLAIITIADTTHETNPSFCPLGAGGRADIDCNRSQADSSWAPLYDNVRSETKNGEMGTALE
jgi:hypothetical protein